ncbi:MAG: hypothetical protein AAGF30_05405 [Pseudomonadota bacterium]
MPDRRFDILGILDAKGLPAPSDDTMAGLLDIVDEGQLGASNHVTLALSLTARIAAGKTETSRDEALVVGEFIAGTRGVAAPIVANALGWQMAGVADLSGAEAAELLADRAVRWGAEAKARRRDLVERAVQVLAACRIPLIFDYSSTVADIVLAMAPRLERVLIPESRAIDGGRRYLAALSGQGFEIGFLPDGAIDWAVGQSDAVLLGAESVSLDGGVLNTIGSISAARAGTAHGVPVYGAADLFKVGSKTARDVPPPGVRSYDFLLRDGETAGTDAPELEMVPPELVTHLLTEVGPVAPADLAAALEQRGA